MPKGADNSIPQINRFDWKKVKDWKFPFRAHTLSDPNYINAKNELFDLNGNGWWWGNGWWNNKTETLMEYNRRLKREKRSIK